MTESVLDYMTRLGRAARQASRLIARASTAQKNRALLAAADALDASRSELTAANELDLANGRANGLEPALLDRLALTPARLTAIANDVRQVCSLADPVGHGTFAVMPLFQLIESHVFAAERLHGDDTTVPILAKSKCTTGRIWTSLNTHIVGFP